MVVSRATFVYVSMLTAFIGGLWIILSFGSTLRPPIDLAGRWELVGAEGTETMDIDQSGRYLNVITPRWKGNLKLHDADAGANHVRMSGSGASASFDGLSLDDTCTIRFEGPLAGTYQARRTVRTHPRAGSPMTNARNAAAPIEASSH